MNCRQAPDDARQASVLIKDGRHYEGRTWIGEGMVHMVGAERRLQSLRWDAGDRSWHVSNVIRIKWAAEADRQAA